LDGLEGMSIYTSCSYTTWTNRAPIPRICPSAEIAHLPSASSVWVRKFPKARALQVPTFIFFKHGKEVGRHVGSTRGDLIGQILQQQNTLGIRPPTMQGKVIARR